MDVPATMEMGTASTWPGEMLSQPLTSPVPKPGGVAKPTVAAA